MRRGSGIVALIWGINILVLLVILGAVVFYINQQPAQAAFPAPAAMEPPAEAIFTSEPTLRPLPTVPQLAATPVDRAPATSTPLALTSGRRATIIGLSVSGRPLEVYTFGQGEKKRMIVAGIHGGYEWNTIALADELITHLDGHPDIIPSDVTIYILRNLNPDGEARGHTRSGRANDRNVDLNRNFPINWQVDWPRDGCWKDPITGGDSPASEPETQALMRFIESHPIDALISYHSAALGVFPGGTPWDEDSKRLAQALSDASDYPYPPIDTGCFYTGTLADYGVSMGAASVDMELSNHRDTDFEINLRVLEVFLNWLR